MHEWKQRFVDRLLAADPPSADARGRYEKEVRAMLEKTLAPRQRVEHLVAAVLVALAAAASGWLAFVLPPELDAGKYLSAAFVLTACALVFVAGILFRAYWKGAVRRRTFRGWAAGVGVAYVGPLGWLFLLMARYIPEILRDDVRVFGLVLLVYAAVAWVRHRVAQAELTTAEKLLEIELRLAEIGEALEARPRPADPAAPQLPPPA
jgi:Na+/proline symporter